MERADDLFGRPFTKVDHDLADTNSRGRGLRTGHSPQGVAYARHKLRIAERFSYKIVGSGIERGHFVFFGIPDSEHDHGYVAVPPHSRGRRQASHPGHIHVEQPRYRGATPECPLAPLRRSWLRPPRNPPHQCCAHEPANLRLVINHDDAARAQATSCRNTGQGDSEGR